MGMVVEQFLKTGNFTLCNTFAYLNNHENKILSGY